MYQYNPILEALSTVYKMKNGTKRLIDVSHKNARKLAGGGKGKSIPINIDNTSFGEGVHKMYDGGRRAGEVLSRYKKGLYRNPSGVMKDIGQRMYDGGKAKRDMLTNTISDFMVNEV